MKLLSALLLPAALLLATGCSGPKVRYDYDAKAAFAQYRTFDWQMAPKDARKGVNQLTDTRIKRAVEAGLAGKGLRREPSADPDILVTAYPTFEKLPGRTRASVGIGLSPFRGLGIGVGTAIGGRRRHVVGSIIFEVEDFKTKQLIWRAVAEEVLNEGATPEEAERDVADAVKEMLTRFPPR